MVESADEWLAKNFAIRLGCFRNEVHDDLRGSLATPIRDGLGLYSMQPRPGFHVLG